MRGVARGAIADTAVGAKRLHIHLRDGRLRARGTIASSVAGCAGRGMGGHCRSNRGMSGRGVEVNTDLVEGRTEWGTE